MNKIIEKYKELRADGLRSDLAIVKAFKLLAGEED